MIGLLLIWTTAGSGTESKSLELYKRTSASHPSFLAASRRDFNDVPYGAVKGTTAFTSSNEIALLPDKCRNTYRAFLAQAKNIPGSRRASCGSNAAHSVCQDLTSSCRCAYSGVRFSLEAAFGGKRTATKSASHTPFTRVVVLGHVAARISTRDNFTVVFGG